MILLAWAIVIAAALASMLCAGICIGFGLRYGGASGEERPVRVVKARGNVVDIRA